MSGVAAPPPPMSGAKPPAGDEHQPSEERSRAERVAMRWGISGWSVVLVVGLAVVVIVLALKLIPRLDAGQKVLNAARPAFTTQRVAGAAASVDFISADVNMADPVVTPAGGAAAEVPKLLAYAAGKTGLSQPQVLALLTKDAPHVAALLQAVPLTAVTSELPGLVAFLSKTLSMTPLQLEGALASDFPALAQAIANLPTVTGGWYAIPGIDGLTRFDGTPVRTVPQLRDYFKYDVIPMLAAQRDNFDVVDSTSTLTWIAPLLLAIGIVVVLVAAFMIVAFRRGGLSRPFALRSAAIVPVVGLIVLALALALRLDPRTNHAQQLVNGLAPAFTAQRVAGDKAGMNMVTAIVDLENPIVTPAGGAAAEVPKLLAFVGAKTGLSDSAVLALLQKNFPHLAALLQAIPLSAVSAELPAVVKLLGPGALPLVPRLAQTIANAPIVTSGWNDVPGTAGFTRFDGTPARSEPVIRDYFADDLIPVLANQRSNFATLKGTSRIDFIGILVLIVALVVIEFGLMMVYAAHRLYPAARPGAAGTRSA